MISRDDVQRLLHRPSGGAPVLSVFLDMSVTSENKRTHGLFLSRWRSQPLELVGDGGAAPREAVVAALESVERWIEQSFEELNKGLAVYAEVGGTWLEGLQLPLPVASRAAIGGGPLVGPLVQVLRSERHHGVVLVDRHHLRMLSIYLGRPLREHEVRTEPYPAPHDVRRGGYSAPDFQTRKAEEVRHFFKEFALEVGEFDRRYGPDDLLLLGTDENVKNFLDFLPSAVREKVVHSAHAPIDATAADLIQRLEPFFAAQRERADASALELLQERLRQSYRAVSGFHDTLEQLQEAKVQTLILARNAECRGSRCARCGFYLARPEPVCPYCGGDARDGVDVVEAMIRLAEEQDVELHFVPADALSNLNGAGALLKF